MKRSLQEQGSEFYSNHEHRDLEEFVEQHYVSNPAEARRSEELLELVPTEAESLLDVGASYGVFLHKLSQRRSMTLEGVDLAETRLEWGRSRGLSMRVASAHELPYESKSFDLVMCSEVLEHLQWGVFDATLRELPRVAKHWLLVSVPYDERRNFVTCPYCGATANPNYHHRSFKPEQMEGLFENFQLTKLQPIEKLSVLTMLKPYLKAPWPSHLVCPACFYRDNRPETIRRHQKFGQFKSLLRSLPFPKRPRWMAALYQRVSD